MTISPATRDPHRSDDGEHTYDMAFHMNGKWNVLPKGERWSPSKEGGYQHISDLTSRSSSEGLRVETRVGGQSIRLILAAGEPTELITGTGVGESTEDRVPIAILRRRAKSTTVQIV